MNSSSEYRKSLVLLVFFAVMYWKLCFTEKNQHLTHSTLLKREPQLYIVDVTEISIFSLQDLRWLCAVLQPFCHHDLVQFLWRRNKNPRMCTGMQSVCIIRHGLCNDLSGNNIKQTVLDGSPHFWSLLSSPHFWQEPHLPTSGGCRASLHLAARESAAPVSPLVPASSFLRAWPPFLPEPSGSRASLQSLIYFLTTQTPLGE